MDRQIKCEIFQSPWKRAGGIKEEAEKQALEEKAEQNGETTGDVQDAGSAGRRSGCRYIHCTKIQNQRSNGRKVAVDPGHQGPGADTGGTEPLVRSRGEMKDKFASGTQGVYTGVPEYELTLNISMQLQAELKSRGYEVIMTREDNDTAVSNVGQPDRGRERC
ncbi:MAG: N-acetylmuramoyl-L-alanine amidase family protein [Blautia sp.]